MFLSQLSLLVQQLPLEGGSSAEKFVLLCRGSSFGCLPLYAKMEFLFLGLWRIDDVLGQAAPQVIEAGVGVAHLAFIRVELLNQLCSHVLGLFGGWLPIPLFHHLLDLYLLQLPSGFSILFLKQFILSPLLVDALEYSSHQLVDSLCIVQIVQIAQPMDSLENEVQVL